jgi:hypothetical protein
VPDTLIAIGQSQSGAFLAAYVNGIQPLAEVFDGFLVHSPAQGALIRGDLDEPTLIFITESEVTAYGHAFARQADSASVRAWEVTGAAHADAWFLAELGQTAYAASCPAASTKARTAKCCALRCTTWWPGFAKALRRPSRT